MMEIFFKMKVQFLYVILSEEELKEKFYFKRIVGRMDIIGKIFQYGDYFIKIFGKFKGIRGELKNICNYFIMMEDLRFLGKRRKGWEVIKCYF